MQRRGEFACPLQSGKCAARWRLQKANHAPGTKANRSQGPRGRNSQAGYPRAICPWSTGSIRALRNLLIKSTLARNGLCTSLNVTGSTPLGQSSPTTGCQGRQDIACPVPLDVLFTRTPQSLWSLKVPNSHTGVVKCIVPGSQDRERAHKMADVKELGKKQVLLTRRGQDADDGPRPNLHLLGAPRLSSVCCHMT